jgi:hypothetical protein
MKASTRTISGVIVLSLLIGARTWSIWNSDPKPETATVGATIEGSPAEQHQIAPPSGTLAEGSLPDEAAVMTKTTLSPESAIEERRQLIDANPELQDRVEQQALARKAEERWMNAVDEGGYSASDLDPSIRNFFSDVGLEPRYEEGGSITGLVIQDLRDDHPLAIAGFRIGDRLNRIQGVALRHPEEIPSLLAHLGPNFSVCRAEDDSDAMVVCEEFSLR